MVTEEFGLQLETPSPIRAALATFSAFVLVGLVPLAPYCLPWSGSSQMQFAVSSISTGVAFFVVGWLKGRVLDHSKLFSGLETLFVGGAAAALAYAVGVALRILVPGAAL
jgi:VIT1/CCC1 family predicted Fe2+/Mn2+ transporter